jgi:glycosyltransferase involved in cell wall biosynthesis
LNICLVTSSYLPLVGGREFVVHNLAIALKELGHDVTVFVPFIKERKNIDLCSYRIVQFGFRGAGRLGLMTPSMYIMFLYVIWRYRIDIINIHGVFQGKAYTFQFLQLLLKMPVIGTPHGDDVQIFPDLNYGVRLDPKNDRIVRRNVNLCDRITAISRSIREHLEDILEDRNRIVDIPNGIWTSTFFNNVNRDETRKKYNLPVNSMLLISVGRNHPKKGFLIAVEALSKLKNKSAHIAYLIIGKDMKLIREKANELGVSELLFTPGQLEAKEVAELFQASDMYISPSLIESFGITTIEAMSAGLPCIVSDIEGSRDIVTSKFGIFTKPGDAQELADAIQKLVENRLLMKKMGEEALLESRKYDWSKIAKMYEKVYRDTIIEKSAI